MKFPILALKHNDNNVYAFSEKRYLMKTSVELLNKNIFQNTVFVDSNGEQFAVMNVVRKKWATLFWGYSLVTKGRQINIDFELESKGMIGLEELKQVVLERVRKRGAYHLQEITPLIKSATDYCSLFRLFY